MDVKIELIGIILMLFTAIKQIHIIQLNSYNFDQQILWYKKNFSDFISNFVLLVFVILANEKFFIPFYIVIVICLLSILLENFPRKQKKKLVLTKRTIRLFAVSFFLFFFFSFLSFYLNKNNSFNKYIYITISLSPFIVFLSYLILLPIENLIKNKFKNEAKKIIDNCNALYVIGITGSYGKTSLKYYLNDLLNTNYNVCMTPESYNTAMGATITIKNNLKSYDDFFICEMGARRINDIKEICDIVSPNACIITDVGNMHLDTFKNIENVKKCKFELVDSVYKNENRILSNKKFNKPLIVYNGDNELIKNHIKTYNFCNSKLISYGFNEYNDFYIEKYSTDESGSIFYVKVDYKSYEFETKLIGKYNIMNLLGAISFAYSIGISIDDIKNKLKLIKQVPHRLQLISNDKNNLIIDDAYNSNLNGAKNAFDVINSFENYKKVVITPGIVELGEKQFDENFKLSEYGSCKVDYAIIVGKTNKEALEKGFLTNLDKNSINYFDKVEDAIFFARNNIEGKKIILLENDLSDNY